MLSLQYLGFFDSKPIDDGSFFNLFGKKGKNEMKINEKIILKHSFSLLRV